MHPHSIDHTVPSNFRNNCRPVAPSHLVPHSNYPEQSKKWSRITKGRSPRTYLSSNAAPYGRALMVDRTVTIADHVRQPYNPKTVLRSLRCESLALVVLHHLLSLLVYRPCLQQRHNMIGTVQCLKFAECPTTIQIT